jgi:hypothetical protein
MTDDMLSYDYLHWLYTAFTRATERLYLVNWPDTQTLNIELLEQREPSSLLVWPSRDKSHGTK